MWPLLPAMGISSATNGIGFGPLLQTIPGWAPYLISGLYAPSLLDGNYRGAVAFTIGAVLMTGVAVGLYLNLFALNDTPPLILISVCVTIGLLALAWLCRIAIASR
jgi:hypothetical protein